MLHNKYVCCFFFLRFCTGWVSGKSLPDRVQTIFFRKLMVSTCPLLCDKCGIDAVHKRMLGVEWDKQHNRSISFYGNAFCIQCLEGVKDNVEQYRPAPGRGCKPPRFIVARQKDCTSITGDQAITLAIAYGNWLKAADILNDALKKKKRFYPHQLRLKGPKEYIDWHQLVVKKLAPITISLPSSKPIKAAQAVDTSTPQTIICKVCGSRCRMNKSGSIRAHRNAHMPTKLCTG
jgi:hypothetical protein